MASFIAHGLMGAAVTTAYSSTCLSRKTKQNFFWAGGVGFFLGILPDVLDWVLAILGLIPRWSLYTWFHHAMPTWMGILILPMGLHVWIDKLFHKYPGYNWWPDLWYLEAGAWVISVLLLLLWYSKLNKEE